MRFGSQLGRGNRVSPAVIAMDKCATAARCSEPNAPPSAHQGARRDLAKSKSPLAHLAAQPSPLATGGGHRRVEPEEGEKALWRCRSTRFT